MRVLQEVSMRKALQVVAWLPGILGCRLFLARCCCIYKKVTPPLRISAVDTWMKYAFRVPKCRLFVCAHMCSALSLARSLALCRCVAVSLCCSVALLLSLSHSLSLSLSLSHTHTHTKV